MISINKDEIDMALDLIEQEKEIAEVKEETTEVAPVANVKSDIDGNALVNLAVESFKDISGKSDEIYDTFYGVVATRQDRSDVSKQMLTDSQRLKIESMNAIANMFNAQAKLAAAQAKAATGNVGVFINSKTGEDVGINLSNLAD